MNNCLFFLVIVPIAFLAMCSFYPNYRENAIFKTSISGIAINFILLLFIGSSFFLEHPSFYESNDIILYHSKEAHYALKLFLDVYSLIYLFIATLLTGIIVIYSKYYIHREKGYKRFFTNILLFYAGLTLILLSGNFETLLIGWEIIGVTSFFLISFYRERYLPVKNALKIVSLYRIADVTLLLGIWNMHHYFGRSINFSELNNLKNQLMLGNSIGNFDQFMVPAVFLIAAMIKSAQYPFSSWLPRAMEGPTSSSAIFYGSLSVHIGVFMLLRISPLWEHNYSFRFFLGAIGLITAIIASFAARVQSTIKSQIAYSSITQIGIIFIELSLVWYWLAIAHFICNALLRSHQLLTSPAVLSYKIHDQIFNFHKPPKQGHKGIWNKLKLSLFILSIKEFNMDTNMFTYLWHPFKKLGRYLSFIKANTMWIISLVLLIIGLTILYHKNSISILTLNLIIILYVFFGLVIATKAFVTRSSALNSWILVGINQPIIMLFFCLSNPIEPSLVYIFLSGIIVSFAIGLWSIHFLQNAQKSISLNHFNGHVYEYPKLAFIFAIACLGIIGFPITPTFLGMDLLINYVRESQFILMLFVFLNLILCGVTVYRLYARLFLGQHISDYHDFPYRSS